MKKVCTKCGDLTCDFSPNKKHEDGLASWCRKCKNKSMRTYVKTKLGLLKSIYSSQRLSSRTRNHKMPNYTLEELRIWALSQNIFHELFDDWEKSSFETKLRPSCDRINDYTCYTLDNLQLITWAENERKGNDDRRNGINNKQNKIVVQYDLSWNKITEFHSINEAGRKTGVSPSNISQCCLGKRKRVSNFRWKYKD